MTALTFNLNWGIGGGAIQTENKESSCAMDENTKYVYMKYPAYDIINSLIVHQVVFSPQPCSIGSITVENCFRKRLLNRTLII